MERRDSLGMAAKEHTERLYGENNESTGLNIRASLQSSEVNTNGVKSQSGETGTGEERFYSEGTFAAEAEVSRIVEEPNYADLRHDSENLPKHSLGSISFGAQNPMPFLDVSGDSKADRNPLGGSVVSIRDIQEVRDKVPASPATKLNEPRPYFQ